MGSVLILYVSSMYTSRTWIAQKQLYACLSPFTLSFNNKANGHSLYWSHIYLYVPFSLTCHQLALLELLNLADVIPQSQRAWHHVFTSLFLEGASARLFTEYLRSPSLLNSDLSHNHTQFAPLILQLLCSVPLIFSICQLL